MKLELLDCFDNRLISLPELPEGLGWLDCTNNQLTSLELPAGLLSLDCSQNLLTSLGPLPGRLWWLDCSHNQLTSLESLPEGLEHLYFSHNQLRSLPEPVPVELLHLEFDNNPFIPLHPRELSLTALAAESVVINRKRPAPGGDDEKEIPEPVLERLKRFRLLPCVTTSIVFGQQCVRSRRYTKNVRTDCGTTVSFLFLRTSSKHENMRPMLLFSDPKCAHPIDAKIFQTPSPSH